MPAPYRLIILRHGRSEWNEKNLFTGWVDVPLNSQGREEAVQAGKLLTKEGWLPDLLYTSLLRRAIVTANLALDECNRLWIPTKRNWTLNERHYGGLQGLDKAEAADKNGAEQVHLWRRSFDVRPPPTSEEYRKGEDDGRYASQGVQVPSTECLKDVLERVLPYWKGEIVPDLKAGKTVMIAAHGNSLRALMKELEGISDWDIPGVEIPTGVPIVYELDEEFRGKGRQLG
ncbi:2,3-bisphosphoglycerate-dependent phosphoglycerate mutase [Fulvia fulva]|uniref:phosphoglycerate mutase (2,3-diphosphoglycerate-dependent) n=1 Tax=Passalora fulva TaxID=5499 RepID=A0A9Q8PIS1_PASFU|nr:2,3-bisphosphoglycerate-dependent phosphoglycerate mutase [Fulvia fulva]KAK4611834.1 2,3-bisphosphoglycerate-dependent phosphoglycerate mutase [Fulvia fulva]KAK4612764.1 2,3-bisphosphoglycerate-dependent phosphoglycerate mutase [Fulvia fulva]UJO23429.1 2,3-bisphosphoglycerate-dependent phosphoglycerate mutase [Fulvia fulva]WPV21420.1 2,3-bisphosphoglycerate-dependent phosphoglycerate mutase [Fulvia fulva]WPV36129.1 2,3-bisphosphoglycerate-dependent phosphoglycerate mutase [Fulvia fulva]